eukprot:COSAG02_NODE_10436_length_1941_cov_1.203040_2_plen_114_part_00
MHIVSGGAFVGQRLLPTEVQQLQQYATVRVGTSATEHAHRVSAAARVPRARRSAAVDRARAHAAAARARTHRNYTAYAFIVFLCVFFLKCSNAFIVSVMSQFVIALRAAGIML